MKHSKLVILVHCFVAGSMDWTSKLNSVDRPKDEVSDRLGMVFPNLGQFTKPTPPKETPSESLKSGGHDSSGSFRQTACSSLVHLCLRKESKTDCPKMRSKCCVCHGNFMASGKPLDSANLHEGGNIVMGVPQSRWMVVENPIYK